MAQGLRCSQAVRRQYPELFLVAKISFCHPYEFAQELESLGVNALHAINTIPYDLIFPPERYPRSPLWQVGGGGVSGGPAWAAAYDYNRGLRQKGEALSHHGLRRRSSREDVKRYFDLGADAVSFCTLALRDWRQAEEIIRSYNE